MSALYVLWFVSKKANPHRKVPSHFATTVLSPREDTSDDEDDERMVTSPDPPGPAGGGIDANGRRDG